MHKVEAQIDDLFNEAYLELTVPTSAFITFESEDSATLCNMVESSNMTLFNQELIFKKCSEPTDIIWENRHFSGWDYIKRQTLVCVLIGMLLVGSFVLIYWVSSFAA